jgi:lysophospholipase L1-like esterase
VLGDSVIWNVGSDSSDMIIERFPGIRTEQLHRVTDNRDLGSPDIVVLQVGTNDLRNTRNLDYVMGEVYGLMNTVKTKFHTSKIILSGVLWGRDMSWQHIGAINNRYNWVAKTLGVTFVDPNCWIDDWDFARDGLHINRRGSRKLGQLYSRVCGTSGGGKKMRSE